jgi:uncharacterized protein DUF5667/IPT/TIG domain-containing protein
MKTKGGDTMQADEQLIEQANRLDALLNQPVPSSSINSTLSPLLNTAGLLAQWGQIQVNPSFADALEAKLMHEVGAAARHDAPTLAQIAVQGTSENGAQPAGSHILNARADAILPARQRQRGWHASRRRVVWQLAAAAAILLCIAVPLSVAAAHAEPGSPLYGLRRLEQGVQAGLTLDPASRAELRLSFARDSLTTLEHAINKGDQAAYLEALASFEVAYKDAKDAVADVPAADQRAPLQNTLEGLRIQASTDLYQALGGMNWANRLTTTGALGQLGNSVPHINQVTFARGAGNASSGDGLTITIHGSGFASGAMVLINGQPSGEVLKVTPEDIQVSLPGISTPDAGTIVGIENPDGTAAEIVVSAHGKPAPQGEPTKTPNNHSDQHGATGTYRQG